MINQVPICKNYEEYKDRMLDFNDWMNDDFLSNLNEDELYILAVEIDAKRHPELLSPYASVMKKYREKKRYNEMKVA